MWRWRWESISRRPMRRLFLIFLISIFNPEKRRPAHFRRIEMVKKRHSRASNMHVACGRRRKTSDDRRVFAHQAILS